MVLVLGCTDPARTADGRVEPPPPAPTTDTAGGGSTETASTPGTGDTTDTATVATSVDLIGLNVDLWGDRVAFGHFGDKGDPFTWIADTNFATAVTNGMGNAVYDPVNHWYVVQEMSWLYALDAATGVVVHEAQYWAHPRGLEYDTVTNQIVGMLHDQDAHFGVFDLATGGFTELVTIPGAASSVAQGTAINSVGRRYAWLAWYDTNDNRITLIDLDTGALLSQVSVGGAHYGGLAHDDLTDRWLLTHFDGSAHRFGELEPSTGTVTYIGTTQAGNGNSAAFDSPTRSYVTDCTAGVCTIDADTGLGLSAISVSGMAYGYVFAR